MDSTQRFSDRVENYVRYRPGYPVGVLQILQEETGLARDAVIADIGAGTGISSELFLANGNTVIGVEPNPEMRRAAESLIERYPGFRTVDGTAEATTLAADSVDYVVAGQAFHWFDPRTAREELGRILRSDGWAVLLVNARRLDSTPFLREYEALLRTFGTDYAEIQHRNIPPESLRSFFAEGRFEVRELYNEQRFDFEGLEGRLLSSSYTPPPGHPSCEPMLKELARVYERHADAGGVRFEYDTRVYFGRLS